MTLLPVIISGEHPPGLVEPNTGEVLALTDCTTAHIAAVRDDLRDLESRIREAKAVLDEEVLTRMDHAAKWTLDAGPYRLSAPSPAPQDHYDAQALHAGLEELVDAGVITRDALNAAVTMTQDYKVRAAGVNALAKLGGPAADTIAAHHHTSDRVRRVTVKRA